MSISSFHGGLEWLQPLPGSKPSPMGMSEAMGAISSSSNILSTRNINEFFNPRKSDLSLEERYANCDSVGEEVIQREELKKLVERKDLFRCYDGFEPSGRMHIAQGIMKSINVNKITAAGGVFIFWIADWFALLNNKMDGDLEKIRTVGRYFVEVWKAAGMDLANVQFLWASEEINKRAEEYWSLVIDISRKFNITRIKKCSMIMGRGEGDDMPTSNILYPCMQCADIFFIKADVCQLGMDQRKVNMLAREYCDAIKKEDKPVIISHHMLSGLKEGQAKMSKSDPDSAIFMEDTIEDVVRKIKKSFCPEKVVENNPILDYCKSIIMPSFGSYIIEVKSFGGKKEYKSYEEIVVDF